MASLKISIGEPDAMEVLASEILDAIRAKDASALAEALCALMDEHAGASEETEEGDSEEEPY